MLFKPYIVRVDRKSPNGHGLGVYGHEVFLFGLSRDGLQDHDFTVGIKPNGSLRVHDSAPRKGTKMFVSRKMAKELGLGLPEGSFDGRGCRTFLNVKDEQIRTGDRGSYLWYVEPEDDITRNVYLEGRRLVVAQLHNELDRFKDENPKRFQELLAIANRGIYDPLASLFQAQFRCDELDQREYGLMRTHFGDYGIQPGRIPFQSMRELQQSYRGIEQLGEYSPPRGLRLHGVTLAMREEMGDHYFELTRDDGGSVDASVHKIDRYRANLSFYDERAQGCYSNRDPNLAYKLTLTNGNIGSYDLEIIY